MAADTIWIKTHRALNDFFQVLTCKKCKRILSNPQQFLRCGHLACAECVGTESDCVQCKIPGEVSDIYSDSVINDILLNLNVIAEAVELPVQKSEINHDLKPSSSNKNNEDSSEKSIRRKNIKIFRSTSIDETLNTSICESTLSRSTRKGKSNEIIPRNINKKNKKGETALHIACRSDNVNRVQLLLEAGANVNTKDNAGWTPLQEAASYGYYEVCEMLLKAGALTNMYGFDNRTALHEAVMNNDCHLASLLFSYNANKKVFDNVGKKPRDYCKSKEMTDLFRDSQESVDIKSETMSETSKTLDFEKSMNHSTTDTKIVLYGSNLKPKTKKLLSKLGIDKKLRIANNLSASVSHVIVDTDATGNVKLTFDLLLTILSGKMLLSSDCFTILMDSKNITTNDLYLFEVNPPAIDDGLIRARENLQKQNPKLFNNCYFYFAIKNYESVQYDDMTITKEELIKLVALGGGITMSREPKPEDIQGSLSPFHVAHNPKHSLHKCTHYVIYVPDEFNPNSNSNRISYNMATLKTLPLMWFIESILRYKLLDPIDLGLTSR